LGAYKLMETNFVWIIQAVILNNVHRLRR
jgi:hypothetical protein